MQLKSVKSVKEQCSIIYSVKEVSQCKSLSFSADELNYIRKQVDSEKRIILLNRYSHVIIIHILSKKKTEPFKKLETIRDDASKINKLVKDHKIEQIAYKDLSDKEEYTFAFLEGFILSNYRFNKYFSDKKAENAEYPEVLNILKDQLSDSKISELKIITEAVYIARNLINEPSSVMNTKQLTEEIVRYSKLSGYKVELFGKKQIEYMKFGGLIAVNKGSIEPPSFSVLEWKPKNARNKKPFILVGKGIVFDTGGVNIKTGKGMEGMHADMSGAAAVIAIMYIISMLKIPVYVTGLIPVTDNRPGQNAYVPNDIITIHNGKTVEVLNTDAEGRMILADALSYASKFNPDLVINIATLTGSAKAAIGHYATVAMGNANKDVFRKLNQSGENVHERIVEFPFWEEYEELIKSDVADVKNTGGPSAGAISAGKFLEKFTDYPFIHLDIAGTAYLSAKDSYRGKGASGVTVRLLFDFIKNFYK